MKKFILLGLILLMYTQIQARPKLSKRAPAHILIIGFDGLSAESLKKPGTMPFYQKMREMGASTLHNRSILPSSSACNWASLYMGAGPEQHGFNTWCSRKPDFPSDTLTAHGLFPDLYFIVKQSLPEAKIAHFYEWEGIHYVVDTLCTTYDRQIDHKKEGEINSVCDYWTREQPFITSIIFDTPDHEGHATGWMSNEYYDGLAVMDNILKQIYQTVEKAGQLSNTLFVLVADHGGKERGHGGTSMSEMETGLVFCGKGIIPNTTITETSSITDITPTITALLGIYRPHAWVGRPLPSVIKRK